MNMNFTWKQKCLVFIGLSSTVTSLFFFMIVFLPNSHLLPDSSLMSELQEIAPFLLSPATGDNPSTYHVLDDCVITTEVDGIQTLTGSLGSPPILLVSLTKFVGLLGFSRIQFYVDLIYVWQMFMLFCMCVSLLQMGVNCLLLVYILLPRKRPKLLFPWIGFSFLLLYTYMHLLVLLVGTMIIVANEEQEVNSVQWFTLLFTCMVSILLIGELCVVILELKEQREIQRFWLRQFTRMQQNFRNPVILDDETEERSGVSVTTSDDASSKATTETTVELSLPSYDDSEDSDQRTVSYYYYEPNATPIKFEEMEGTTTLPMIPDYNSLPPYSYLDQDGPPPYSYLDQDDLQRNFYCSIPSHMDKDYNLQH